MELSERQQEFNRWWSENVECKSAKKCRFCDKRAVAYCNWPEGRFAQALYRELQPGDTVRRLQHKGNSKRPATVWHVSTIEKEGYIDARLIVLKIGSRFKEITVRGYSLCQKEIQGPCSVPVCENHLRCVEPGVEYCYDHWRSWEAVA